MTWLWIGLLLALFVVPTYALWKLLGRKFDDAGGRLNRTGNPPQTYGDWRGR